MKHIRSYQYILPGTIVFSIFLMLIGICIGDASEILPGLWKIVTMQDLLITDYIDIAGPAAAFVNAGLVTIISICLIWLAKDPFNGFTIVEMGLMAGFPCSARIFLISGPSFWERGCTLGISGSRFPNTPPWRCFLHPLRRW